jgi:hypothetical protein
MGTNYIHLSCEERTMIQLSLEQRAACAQFDQKWLIRVCPLFSSYRNCLLNT